MLGSHPHECATPDAREHLFSVTLSGQTLWGWHRRGESGDIIARSEHLFADYVTCLCDARRCS